MALPHFADDSERLDWVARTLYSAVISDACDSAGHRDRALGPDIRPLDETTVLVGRAKTVVWAPMYHVPDRPYDREIAAVDSLRPGEVFVMAVGRSREIVPWGELLSTATIARGGRGAVLDGLVRDSRRIIEMGLPVFCTGRRPYDSCGRGIITEFDVPVVVDGVAIDPGDLVFGDADGVVVVPRTAEAAILERAWPRWPARTPPGSPPLRPLAGRGLPGIRSSLNETPPNSRAFPKLFACQYLPQIVKPLWHARFHGAQNVRYTIFESCPRIPFHRVTPRFCVWRRNDVDAIEASSYSDNCNRTTRGRGIQPRKSLRGGEGRARCS